MTVSKEQAYTTYTAEVLGQEEGIAALDKLTKEERAEYDAHVEAFNEGLAKAGMMAQMELGELVEKNPELLELSPNKGEWSIDDFRYFLDVIEGSHFEKLHLVATFGLDNRKALLEQIKP